MDDHLKNIHAAADEVDMREIHADRAHEAFVQAICTALAAQVPPEEVAAAANMSLGGVLDILRKPTRSKDKSNAVQGA